MDITFYNTVKEALKTDHVVVFVNTTDNAYLEQEANTLLSWLEDEIRLDRMNVLEAVTDKGNFICVRNLREQIPISSNPGYKLMLLPEKD